MAVASPSFTVLRFGLYELDPSRWELRRRGVLIGLQQQPCHLLHLLASHPQTVIGRDHIRRCLWPDEIAGEFDTRINYCIVRIREALGDEADNPRFIQTVRGQGYCFLPPQLDLAPPPSPPPPSTLPSPVPPPAAPAREWGLAPIALAGLLAVLASAWLIPAERLSRPAPALRIDTSSTLAITNGPVADHLVSAANYVYYTGTAASAGPTIFRVPAAGGFPAPIASDLRRPSVLAASPDGRELAVSQDALNGEPASAWLLPAAGGRARRFGAVRGPYVAWRPDGQAVAFSVQDSVWLADAQGENAHKLATTPGAFTAALAWAPDSRDLAFAADDQRDGRAEIWESAATGGTPRLLMTLPGMEGARQLVWLKDRRHLLLNTTRRDDHVQQILTLTLASGEQPSPAAVLLASLPNSALAGPALDAHGRVLVSDVRGVDDDVLRWQPARAAFLPYLYDARDVNFSPDHARIAYVRASDSSLWLARADGSQARQLVGPPLQAMSPRWSPDGARIAFAGLAPQANWRLYLIAADGHVEAAGRRHEQERAPAASHRSPHSERPTGGNGRQCRPCQAKTAPPPPPLPLPDPHPLNGQGAPTWLPDGTGLIYANVACLVPASCGVHLLNLLTRLDTLLPGSGGLRTARLSPNGRWIAAIRDHGLGVVLYDLAHPAHPWRALLSHPVGDYLEWSGDSRSLYFASAPALTAVVERFPLPQGPFRVVATLFDPAPTSPRSFDGLGLAPGDLPMLSLMNPDFKIEALRLALH